MPETYGSIGVTVPEQTDYNPGGPDVPRAFKEHADSFGTGQGKGKLLIAQNTGAAAWAVIKGDAMLAEDGTISLVPTAGHFESHGAALTRASTSLGAFSTPVKVTLPKVKAGQIIEVVAGCYVKSSVASTEVGGGSVGIAIGGVTVVNQGLYTVKGASELAANTYLFALLGAEGFAKAGAVPATPATLLGKVLPSGGLRFVASAEATSVIVELQGASATGTITVEDVILAARVWG